MIDCGARQFERKIQLSKCLHYLSSIVFVFIRSVTFSVHLTDGLEVGHVGAQDSSQHIAVVQISVEVENTPGLGWIHFIPVISQPVKQNCFGWRVKVASIDVGFGEADSDPFQVTFSAKHISINQTEMRSDEGPERKKHTCLSVTRKRMKTFTI